MHMKHVCHLLLYIVNIMPPLPLPLCTSPLPILCCDVNVNLMYLLYSTLGLRCNCNINHSACVNNSCTTDTECQRVVHYTNCAITSDSQLCVPSDQIRNPCGFVDTHFANDSVIEISAEFCCRTERCNANDTLVKEFIERDLGTFVILYACMYRVCHVFFCIFNLRCISTTKRVCMVVCVHYV